MGEAKRRGGDRAVALTRELIDAGKLIESGLAIYANYFIPQDTPPAQVREMHLAFMAGAEHVWMSMLAMLDAGAEPSEVDLRRMDSIQRELTEWRTTQRMNQPGGSA